MNGPLPERPPGKSAKAEKRGRPALQMKEADFPAIPPVERPNKVQKNPGTKTRQKKNSRIIFGEKTRLGKKRNDAGNPQGD